MRSLTALLLLTGSCIAHSVCAEGLNPPPSSAFGGYQAYELKPLAISDELKGSETGLKATAKIQENIDARLKPIIAEWTQKSTGQGNGSTLVIEPSVNDLRFINGAKRFFAGALAGSSHVVMKVRIVEQPGDKVIAEPEFYQHASGMAGAWTVGAHDNTMLNRVVDLAANYLSANFDGAVGGPSGREELEKEKKK